VFGEFGGIPTNTNLLKPLKTLSTTTAVVSATIPPENSRWMMRCTGVVCFEKDYLRKSFFVRVYDLEVCC